MSPPDPSTFNTIGTVTLGLLAGEGEDRGGGSSSIDVPIDVGEELVVSITKRTAGDRPPADRDPGEQQFLRGFAISVTESGPMLYEPEMSWSEEGRVMHVPQFLVPPGWKPPEPEPKSIYAMEIGDELEVEEHADGHIVVTAPHGRSETWTSDELVP